MKQQLCKIKNCPNRYKSFPHKAPSGFSSRSSFATRPSENVAKHESKKMTLNTSYRTIYANTRKLSPPNESSCVFKSSSFSEDFRAVRRGISLQRPFCIHFNGEPSKERGLGECPGGNRSIHTPLRTRHRESY